MSREVRAKPCNDCPFRKDSMRGWLGDYKDTRDLLNTAVHSEQFFVCHMAVNWGAKEEQLEKEIAEAPLCKGALLFMAKVGKLPHHPELAQAVKDCKNEDKENILGLKEIYEHHDNG